MICCNFLSLELLLPHKFVIFTINYLDIVNVAIYHLGQVSFFF